LDKRIRESIYTGYSRAQLQVGKKADDKEEERKNNRTLQDENLAEMAPFYTEEVVAIIRDYWTDKYWTPQHRTNLAKAIVKKLKLKKPAVTAPVRSPTVTPRTTPTPTPAPVGP
jgi:hypothetical protein